MKLEVRIYLSSLFFLLKPEFYTLGKLAGEYADIGK